MHGQLIRLELSACSITKLINSSTPFSYLVLNQLTQIYFRSIFTMSRHTKQNINFPSTSTHTWKHTYKRAHTHTTHHTHIWHTCKHEHTDITHMYTHTHTHHTHINTQTNTHICITHMNTHRTSHIHKLHQFSTHLTLIFFTDLAHITHHTYTHKFH